MVLGLLVEVDVVFVLVDFGVDEFVDFVVEDF